ncbi:hypothetical protein [Enterococcus sp. BWR-S5]|uniref:hypothetical protein n=1 Tax=Enterococcus sp. BWR-S5 TaxID=2787714 RepID=UPI001F237E6A|nr:hypothetical protein [Enterococcus sp. BWR-S5]
MKGSGVKMTKYFKLITGIDTAMTLNVARTENGQAVYSHVRLNPGERYELGDDDLFIQSLKQAKAERRYSKQLETQLKASGIDYTQSICKSCGGKATRLSYSVIEIIDE